MMMMIVRVDIDTYLCGIDIGRRAEDRASKKTGQGRGILEIATRDDHLFSTLTGDESIYHTKDDDDMSDDDDDDDGYTCCGSITYLG